MFWIYIAGMHVEKLRRSFFGENSIVGGIVRPRNVDDQEPKL